MQPDIASWLVEGVLYTPSLYMVVHCNPFVGEPQRGPEEATNEVKY